MEFNVASWFVNGLKGLFVIQTHQLRLLCPKELLSVFWRRSWYSIKPNPRSRLAPGEWFALRRWLFGGNRVPLESNKIGFSYSLLDDRW